MDNDDHEKTKQIFVVCVLELKNFYFNIQWK